MNNQECNQTYNNCDNCIAEILKVILIIHLQIQKGNQIFVTNAKKHALKRLRSAFNLPNF